MMTVSTRISLLAVALAVVTAAMVGVVTGNDEADAATQHTLRIPAAAFTPINHNIDFGNTGLYLRNLGSGSGAFLAPVLLEGNSATIHSIKLHFYDEGAEAVCAYLYRPRMKAGTERKIATNCSKNSASQTRNQTVTNINPNTVSADEGLYVYLTMPGSLDYAFYGVTIVYTSDL